MDRVRASLAAHGLEDVIVREFAESTATASDAAAADLILLSVHGQGNWPPSVERWMELLVSERAAQRGGLAAVLVRPQAAASAARERCATLEQLAQLSGRDFFFAKDVDWMP